MKKISLVLLFGHLVINSFGQNAAAPATVLQKQYLNDLQTTGRTFSRPFRQNYVQIYSLPDNAFIAKMDSARSLLLNVLDRYRAKLDAPFVKEQDLEINYYIDKLLIDYPGNYTMYTGKNYADNKPITEKLKHTWPVIEQAK